MAVGQARVSGAEVGWAGGRRRLGAHMAGHSRRKERAVWPEGGGRASPGTGNAGHGLMYQELGGSVSPVGQDLFDKP